MLFCGVCKSFTTHKASFVNYFSLFQNIMQQMVRTRKNGRENRMKTRLKGF